MDFRHFHNTIHIQAHKYLLYNTHTHKHVFKRRVWWAGGWCDLAWITNPVQSNPIQSKRRGWWAGGWCDLAWIAIQSSPNRIQSNPNAGVGGLVDGAIWPGLLSNPVQSNPIQSKRRVWWAGGWCDLAWTSLLMNGRPPESVPTA